MSDFISVSSALSAGGLSLDLMPRVSATMEICLHLDGTLLAHVDGVRLQPVAPAIKLDDIYTRVDAAMRTLTHGLGTTQKLVRYRANLASIGQILGRALLGQPQGVLAQTLDTLYTRARARGQFIAICLSAANPELHNLPWELALWQPSGHAQPVRLGTDEHLALVRQALYRGFVDDRTTSADAAALRITHITADRDQRAHAHERIASDLHEIMRHNWRVRASASFSEEWARQHPDGDRHTDILQLLAHGSRAPGTFELAVATPETRSRALELDVHTLLTMLGQRELPRLFVMLSCWSFDHRDHRGTVADLLHAGGSTAMGILGMLRLGKAPAISRYFYHQMLEHGRVDLAVQRLRGLLERYELFESMTPDPLLPSDWFRPVLMIRTPGALEAFRDLPASTVNPIDRRATCEPADALKELAARQERALVLSGTARYQRLARDLRDLDPAPIPDPLTARDALERWEATRLDTIVAALASGASMADVDVILNIQLSDQKEQLS
jgi:PAS domain-containing protein